MCLRCACVSHTVSWANTPVKLVIRMPPIATPLMDGSRVDRDARVSMCLCVFKWPSMPFAVTSWSARRVCSGLGACALCFLAEPRPPSGLCIYMYICFQPRLHASSQTGRDGQTHHNRFYLFYCVLVRCIRFGQSRNLRLGRQCGPLPR